MQRSLIIGLLSALILVIFALRNSVPVELDFIIGKPVQGSLSLILLITVIIGIFVGLLLSYPTLKKFKSTISDQKSEINTLSNILDEYKKEYGVNKQKTEGKNPEEDKKEA
jgi:uncharacterized integral membrane protein